MANQNFKVKNGLEVGPNSSGIGTIITTTSSGLVGVAITNPTYTLTVAGSGTSTTQLYVTGVSTHIGISTFTETLFANQVSVVGPSTLGGITTSTGTFFADELSVVGPSTLGGITTSGGTLFANQVSVVGPSTLGGITTSGGTLFAKQLSVVGPSTLGGITTSTSSLFAKQLSVVGPSTLGGITTSTNSLFAKQLSVVGPSTLGGITTSTGTLFVDELSTVGPSTLGGITTSRGTLFANQFSVAGVSTFRNDLKLPDNVGLEVGTGVGSTDYDFRLYHNGSHTYLDQQNTTGNIYIRNTRTSGSIFLQADNSSGTLRTVFAATGASSGAELYYDGTKRFETINGGAAVSAGFLVVNSTAVTSAGTGVELQVVGDGYFSGRVGIGITLPSSSDLHVFTGSQGTQVPAVIIQSSDTTVSSNNILLELDFSGDTNGNGGYFVRCQDADTTLGGIRLNGAASINFENLSDYRLKTNIQPLTGSVDRVLSLKPCTFDFIDGNSSEGFIAHELQEVVPLAVTGTKDEVDEDGNILPQGVDPRHVVPVLTAALQEALKRIEELEIKVAEIESLM